MIGLLAISLMNRSYIRWEMFVGRSVMVPLEQTTARLSPDNGSSRNVSLDLVRLGLLLLWVIFDSSYFVLVLLSSSSGSD